MDTKEKNQLENFDNRDKKPDVETAAELSPPSVNPVGTSRTEKKEVDGSGIGVTALILSLLAFFLFPFILSALGIILGIVGAQRGSTAGWWAIGIGAFVLLVRILAFPLMAIF
jgi:uncharacterized membrane protein